MGPALPSARLGWARHPLTWGCPLHLQPAGIVQPNGAEGLGQGQQPLAEVINPGTELIRDAGSLQGNREVTSNDPQIYPNTAPRLGGH